MTPFDAGYLFFLLPAAAALCVLAPRRARLWATAVLGAALLWFSSPLFALPVLLSIAFDWLACRAVARWGLRSAALLLLLSAAAKDAAAIGFFGVWLPLWGAAEAPFGVLVVHLSLLLFLVGVCRGNPAALSPAVFGAYQLFPGRLSIGPFLPQGRCERLLRAQRLRPAALLEGVCGVIAGAAKYVLLARPLRAVSDTLANLIDSDPCAAGAWAAAAIPAMALWITLSAYSDTAWGLGRVFGAQMPAVMRMPAGARGARDHVWRLNMPLTEQLLHTCLLDYRRTRDTAGSTLLTAAAPFFLAMLLGLTRGLLLWAAWLSAFCLLDRLLLPVVRRLSHRLTGLLTLLCLLPGYALAGGSGTGLRALSCLAGRGVPPWNEKLLYLCRSNALLLVVSLALCTGLPASASGLLRRRFPAVWRLCAAAAAVPMLVLTASFLIQK